MMRTKKQYLVKIRLERKEVPGLMSSYNIKVIYFKIFSAWSDADIKKLETKFKTFITRNIYPSGQEIKSFLSKHKMNRSVPVVKAKLQHLMKQK